MKTIFRLEKIQKDSEVVARSKHCYQITQEEKRRFIKYRNKEFNKPIYTLIGNRNLAYRDIKNLKKNRIKDLKKDLRKNHCKGFEMVFSLSPEFFEKENDCFNKDKVKIFTNRTLNFLKNEFGKENIAHCVLHLHEETPHIHCFYIPFEETNKRGNKTVPTYTTIKTQKYNREYISDLQQKYFNVFEDLEFKPLNKKIVKGKDRTELKDHYVNKINEMDKNVKELENLKLTNESLNSTIKDFKEELENLDIKNDILLKELNETKTELEKTKKELSKLQKVIELVKNFFNVDKMKELIEKIRPEQKEEKKSMINYDEVEEKIKTSLKPKPEPASQRFRKKRKF